MRFAACIRLVAAALLALPAFPWGADGHRLIAEIAQRHLKPEALAEIQRLLPPGETIVSIAPWADEIRAKRRESAPWHYINIPIDAPRGQWQPWCPNNDCIITAIERFAARLADRRLPAAEREEALKFLVHFVGDLHQPLHCGDNRDRGGNDVPVVFRNRPTNLHSIWDTPLLREAVARPGVRERLLVKAGRREKSRASQGGAGDWVWESHQISRTFAYPALPLERPAILGDEYAERAYPYIVQQVRLAGLRLASLLNQSLGGAAQ